MAGGGGGDLAHFEVLCRVGIWLFSEISKKPYVDITQRVFFGPTSTRTSLFLVYDPPFSAFFVQKMVSGAGNPGPPKTRDLAPNSPEITRNY